MELITIPRGTLVKGAPDEVIEFMRKLPGIPDCAFKMLANSEHEEQNSKANGGYKRSYSDFGISVALALFMKGKTQKWLISEIKRRSPTTCACVDSLVLNEVMTGRIASGRIVDTIKTVLGISG